MVGDVVRLQLNSDCSPHPHPRAPGGHAQNFGVRLLAKERPDGEAGKLAEFEAAANNLALVRLLLLTVSVAIPLQQPWQQAVNTHCQLGHRQGGCLALLRSNDGGKTLRWVASF